MSSTTASVPEQEHRCTDCGEPVPAARVEQLLKLARAWTSIPPARLVFCTACGQRLVEEGRRETAPEQLAPEDIEDRRLHNSGLPPAFWNIHLREAQADVPKEVVDALHAWSMLRAELRPDDPAVRGVFLWGKVGRGKTWLAAAAARSMLVHRPVRWTSVPVLVTRWYSAFGSEDREKALSTLLGREALVLDDLGQERASDEVRQALFTALDERITQRAPLVITSNLMPSELGERYGAWLPSRIQGYCFTARVEGHDRRLT